MDYLAALFSFAVFGVVVGYALIWLIGILAAIFS